jgi:hypothetical protein
MTTPFARALVSGTVASLATTAALSLLARGAGRPAVAPINATSHWLHGDAAADRSSPDAAHTLVGYVTHHGATVFWACLFERLAGLRGRPGAPVLFRNAAAVAAIAAVVDYGIVPKRLTPGWELVLPKRRVATTYAVLAAGLAVGGWLSQRRRA